MRETSAVYDKDQQKQLEKEEKRATKLLKGKIVRKIWRYRKQEVAIDFKDGTKLFVDCREEQLDLSITGNFEEDE